MLIKHLKNPDINLRKKTDKCTICFEIMSNKYHPFISKSLDRKEKIAISGLNGEFTYDFLAKTALSIAACLEEKNMNGSCVAFLIPADFRYVATLWGIWQAGAMALPLSPSHPAAEIAYFLHNSQCRSLICTADNQEQFLDLCLQRGISILLMEEMLCTASTNLLSVYQAQQRALMIYTSGTTGKAKGVVHTFSSLIAQIDCLVKAWKWTEDDHILNILPLHHIHGIVNVVSCAMWAGAKLEMRPRFDASEVWSLFEKQRFTLFMAVPTIFHRLIEHWEKANENQKIKLQQALSGFRLMVSGSAALPVTVLEKWQKISGHFLLERYGMTEIGMALSNPLEGQRKKGSVGKALPNVEVKLVDENDKEITAVNEAGELWVSSPALFLEYWQNPQETEKAFKEGWFCTGDVAYRDEEGYYFIIGRKSTDIIKSGGYKISALEIEEVLRTHPLISECAVVGVKDEQWGEKIAVALVLGKNRLALDELRLWAKQYLASYKIPTLLKVVEQLPLNAMGKVIKPKIRELFLNP